METLYDFFAKPKDPRIYSGVKIALASPEQIRSWSSGEVKKPETINYRTFKPERDGLFCAKIFGPIKDFECNCGKYKRMKHRGVVCEKCGVEVVQSKVRRERMGHIELAAPCSHIWFLKSLPSKLGNVLDLNLKNLEKVLYYDLYIVIDPKETDLTKGQLLTDEEYYENLELYGDKFEAGIGAEAIKQMLEQVDLAAEYARLRSDLLLTESATKRQKLSKRLKIIDSFKRSELSPSCMIMECIPVLPPDLRPLVPLEGGRFATSDLNDLYRRVINRNNRLKRLIDPMAPDIIIRNEKRMLQEAVDVLFDNGRQGRPILGTNKRPLKSLSDTLKGKQGRFRQNLLGKRVDYSGRTVITVGPNLRLHQCGLPKKMALELFKPFVYCRLEKMGLVSTVKSAKKMLERGGSEVWDTLEEVVKEYPILLNRAPTLHRLGVQAFEPILIEGKAIQLHPLVCTAFNADFDGDQMAVHIPLSIEAQIEARALVLSSNNILSPANGSPVIIPSQDIVLGLYYMTRFVEGLKGDGKVFSSPDEVRSAYDSEAVDLHAQIKARIGGKRYDTTVGRVLLWEIIPKLNLVKFNNMLVSEEKAAEKIFERLKSGESFGDLRDKFADELIEGNDYSTGLLTRDEFKRVSSLDPQAVDDIFSLNTGEYTRIIDADGRHHFFEMLSKRLAVPFDIINKVMDKKNLRDLVDYAYRNLGIKATVILSDKLKDVGYKYSTVGGLSISIDAMIIPSAKKKIIGEADTQVKEIGRQYSDGLITQGEKYNKVVDIWAKATDDVANEMMNAMKDAPKLDASGVPVVGPSGKPVMVESFNPIYMMADSGARGSKDQMRQLAGMRGLMAKPSGEIIETPINANFREGLSVLQYFISTHGARKGLADTALKTANSGYLTRRLADVAQDCIVSIYDCGTKAGVEVEPLLEGGEIIQRLGERILGRVTMENIHDPFTDEILVKEGEFLTELEVDKIENAGITNVKIRSVLTCKAKNGVCVKCYGRDLAHGGPVEIGEAVGILAAQSIGEPGTQLTMRTFHIGGTASRRVEQADIRTLVSGSVKYIDLRFAVNSDNNRVVMNRRGGEVAIIGENGRERERYPVIYGAHLAVEDGSKINSGDLIASWDPFTTPIIAENTGTIRFKDIEIGKSMQEKVDFVTGKSSRTIIESRSTEERPRIIVKSSKEGKADSGQPSEKSEYILPLDAILLVEEQDGVFAGDIIAKLPRATTKTKDITGGLPRVAELFEVRTPKEKGILSEIDGYVSLAPSTRKGKRKIVVTPAGAGDKKEYLVATGKHVIVNEGDYVRAGESIVSGSAVPQDILNIKGEIALAKYLVDEVQEVYRLQGVRINDKHIEVIVRQMMSRVLVKAVGETDFILEQQVDRKKFETVNNAIKENGGDPAAAAPLILGITKASLSTESFISAASFQETTKVLSDASIAGKVDPLLGLKENVIMGRLIPAGTGFSDYHNIDVESITE